MAQFEKGRSGNPGGRPKGTSLTAELRKLLEETDPDGKSVRRQLAESVVALALEGDVRAHAVILERLEGKAGLMLDEVVQPSVIENIFQAMKNLKAAGAFPRSEEPQSIEFEGVNDAPLAPGVPAIGLDSLD